MSRGQCLSQDKCLSHVIDSLVHVLLLKDPASPEDGVRSLACILPYSGNVCELSTHMRKSIRECEEGLTWLCVYVLFPRLSSNTVEPVSLDSPVEALPGKRAYYPVLLNSSKPSF